MICNVDPDGFIMPKLQTQIGIKIKVLHEGIVGWKIIGNENTNNKKEKITYSMHASPVCGVCVVLPYQHLQPLLDLVRLVKNPIKPILTRIAALPRFFASLCLLFLNVNVELWVLICLFLL